MTTIRFEIPHQPQPKQRPRVVGKRAYTPDRTRDYERLIAWYAGIAHPDNPLSGDLWVTCYFYRKGQRRADVDNLLKAVLDACNGILWHDDQQIVALTGLVQYGSKSGSVVVEVKKIA